MGDTDLIEQVSFFIKQHRFGCGCALINRKNQRHVPAPYRNSSAAAAVIPEAEIP